MPRPSSPVHAKASTNCPYLTLESPHHQRQHWIGLSTDTKLGRAACVAFLGVVKILSLCCDGSQHVRTSNPKIASASTPTPHGIDLKNPFTMSNIGGAPITLNHPMSTMGKSFSSSSKIIGQGVRTVPASPSVAVKLRLVARFVALAALTSFALVEPIGIEPMT